MHVIVATDGSKQSLAAAKHPVADVEDDRCVPVCERHGQDATILFLDEQPARRAGGDPDRGGQALGNDLQRQRRGLSGDRAW